MSKKTTKKTEQVIEIEITKILPDPNNHRQTIHEEADIELAASIKDHGVLQAITVRPCLDQKGFDFYVVFGERRLRASKIAKLKTIPSVIRDIPIEDVLEIQFIENLQREDISHMDEAITFNKLLQQHSLDWLCSKIHKSKKYVSDRLKLINLNKVAQALLSIDKLPLSHAIMISKLDAEDQITALEKCFPYEDFEEEKIDVDELKDTHIEITLDDLRDEIDRLFTDLSKAAFDTNDETLHADAGACTNCVHRTKNSQLLFAEITDEDKCTQVACFKLKTELHLKRAKMQAEEQFGNKLLSAKIDSNSGSSSVIVKGQKVNYSEKEGKGLAPVIITNTDNYRSNSLGKTVYVAEKELEKPAKPVVNKVASDEKIDQQYNEQEAMDVKLIVRLLQSMDLKKVHDKLLSMLLGEIFIKADLLILITICHALDIDTGIEAGKEASFVSPLSYDEKRAHKEDLTDKLFQAYPKNLTLIMAIALFCDNYSDELAFDDDDEEDYYKYQITLTRYLKAIGFVKKEETKK